MQCRRRLSPDAGSCNGGSPRSWRHRDTTTIAARAATGFADHGPGWPLSVITVRDVQIAAAEEEAIEAGEFLAVIGDDSTAAPTRCSPGRVTRFATPTPPALVHADDRTADRPARSVTAATVRSRDGSGRARDADDGQDDIHLAAMAATRARLPDEPGCRTSFSSTAAS